MKVGDLVRFTNRNHTLNWKYSGRTGLITDIDHLANTTEAPVENISEPKSQFSSQG